MRRETDKEGEKGKEDDRMKQEEGTVDSDGWGG